MPTSSGSWNRGAVRSAQRRGSGIQVSLFSGEAAVAIAYWHTGPAARAVMQIVWTYLAILEQETGWEVYDGQLGRSLNRSQDLDEVTGWYADLTARLHQRVPG